MPSRRLEDRIRYLCGKIVKAENSELESISEDLRASLHENAERLRTRHGNGISERRTAMSWASGNGFNHNVHKAD